MSEQVMASAEFTISLTEVREVKRLIQAVHALLLARLVSSEAGALLPIDLWNELIDAHDDLTKWLV